MPGSLDRGSISPIAVRPEQLRRRQKEWKNSKCGTQTGESQHDFRTESAAHLKGERANKPTNPGSRLPAERREREKDPGAVKTEHRTSHLTARKRRLKPREPWGPLELKAEPPHAAKDTPTHPFKEPREPSPARRDPASAQGD